MDLGNWTEASRWLDRAHRLAPDDPTVTLTAASAALGHDNTWAAVLFERVLRTHDLRDAWFGLASARYLQGDLPGARAALADCLSRHAPHDGIASLADRITRGSGAPGWCGLTAKGILLVHPNGSGPFEIRMDGHPVAAGQPLAAAPDTSTHALPARSPAHALPARSPAHALPAQSPFHAPVAEWPSARRATVLKSGQPLIGSPLSVCLIRATEGYVTSDTTGVCIRAWHPSDPETDPTLRIKAGTVTRGIVLTERIIPGPPLLACPRETMLPWADLGEGDQPVHVLDQAGRELPGSPARRNDTPFSSRPGRRAPARQDVTVVIRFQDGHGAGAAANVRAILASMSPGEARCVVIDNAVSRAQDIDATVVRVDPNAMPGPNLTPFLGRDLILLDAAIVLPPRWLERLREAAYQAPDIGIVVPFSNEGAASCPDQDGRGLAWFGQDVRTAHQAAGRAPARRIVASLDRMARRAAKGIPADLESAFGPCLYIRGDCLISMRDFVAALLDERPAAMSNFSARARAAGWRLVAAPGLFAGLGPGDIDTNRPDPDLHPLLPRGAVRTGRDENRRNPGDGIAGARPSGALDLARRRLDLARWQARAKNTMAPVIFVTHDDGGGVARQLDAAIAAVQASGGEAIVLRPARINVEQDDETIAVTVDDGRRDRFPGLRFAMPAEKAALTRLLRAARPVGAAIHHFLNHDPSVVEAVQSLGIPYDVHVHDFAWYCPRVALVGRGDQYCGEPEPAACEACVAETGRYLHEDIGVAALITRSRGILTGARRVIAPSLDTKRRMARHFPGLALTVEPHEDDRALDDPPPVRAGTAGIRICVAGGIGLHKGFHVLLACARDARDRGLDLTFTVVGKTIDDLALIETGHVFVTGGYEAAEATALIRAQEAMLGFFPSIGPETWSLTLTEIWRAGLRVAAFDIGAPAERIRRTGRGILLPLGLPPPDINDALLNAAKGRSFLPIRRTSAYKPSTNATLSK